MAERFIPRRTSKPHNDLTATYVRSILSYDPLTGILTWKRREDARPQWNGVFAGKPAGALHPNGYIIISINNRLYRAHRLAWLIMTGEWPLNEIDHKYRNRADNRWHMLREATHAQNAYNMKRSPKSGFKGVILGPAGRWHAQITYNFRNIFLGSFATKEQAAKTYDEAAKQLYGDYASHNNIST